jgi:hypothetical protein
MRHSVEPKENTMDSKSIVQSFMYAIQKGEFERAKSHLADDFQFSGPIPDPINADAWLGMSMNMGVIPPTNKSFAVAREHGKITVKGDKVTSWSVEPTKGAGLKAIMEQLGVKLPTI